MTDPELLSQRLAGSVPYFFYDLFGRIFPGLFFLAGLAFTLVPADRIHYYLAMAERRKPSSEALPWSRHVS